MNNEAPFPLPHLYLANARILPLLIGIDALDGDAELNEEHSGEIGKVEGLVGYGVVQLIGEVTAVHSELEVLEPRSGSQCRAARRVREQPAPLCIPVTIYLPHVRGSQPRARDITLPKLYNERAKVWHLRSRA